MQWLIKQILNLINKYYALYTFVLLILFIKLT